MISGESYFRLWKTREKGRYRRAILGSPESSSSRKNLKEGEDQRSRRGKETTRIGVLRTKRYRRLKKGLGGGGAIHWGKRPNDKRKKKVLVGGREGRVQGKLVSKEKVASTSKTTAYIREGASPRRVRGVIEKKRKRGERKIKINCQKERPSGARLESKG